MTKKEEFSQEKHNLEVVDKEKEGKTQITPWDKKDSGQGNVFIGTLNLFAEPFRERHEKHYKESKFHLIVDTILAAIVLILLAILVSTFFWRPEQEIALEISNLSDTIASGQEEVFAINYSHEGERTIQEASLAISLPEDFILTRVVPEDFFNFKTNTFDLGELTSGANGEVKIAGVVLGDPGSRQIISSVFNYKIENHEMRELSSRGYNIEGSKLNFNLKVPEQVYQETEFNGSFKLVNHTDIDWDDLKIEFSPSHWNLQEIYGERECSWENQSISIGNLPRGENVNLNFRALSNSSPGQYNLDWKIIGQREGREFGLREGSKTIEIKKPNFELSLSPNRSVFDLGDSPNFSLSFTNKEEEEIKELYLKLDSGEQDFDLSDFNLLGKNEFKQEGERILVGSLSPGESEKIDLDTSWTRKNIGVNQGISLAVEVEYQLGGQRVKFRQTSPLVKLLSQLNISSAGYYYSPQGDQLGVGPLPPQINMSTSYWVFWEINNLGNQLSDITVSAQLPDNVVWTDDKTLLAGKLMHGAISNRVVWELETVESQGGKYRAGFKINLIPGEEDEGKILDLLRNINYSAYDQFCGQEIRGALSDITTDLNDDPLASDKGRVISFQEN